MRRIFSVLVGDGPKWISVFSIYCNNGVRWKILVQSLEEVAGHFLAENVETMTERAVAIIKEVRPSHMTFYFQVGAAPHDVAVHSMERWVGEVMPGIEKA